MDRALELPLGAIERAGSGDLLARVGGDVDAVADAVRSVLPTLATSALTIGLTVVAWAALDWRFALAGLCAAPIQAHTLRWYLRRSSPLYAAERVAEGDRAQQLLDSIGGAATVRALRLSDRHVDEVAMRSGAAMEYAFAATRLRTRFYGRLNVAELVGLSMILLTGFLLVRDGTVTVGAATAAALYFSRLFDPINALLILVDVAQEAGAGLARLVGIAALPPPVEPAHPAVPLDASIEATAVSYAYEPGHDVLHDITVAIAPGTHVALVGASGAGKTTLAKLVAGLHVPDAGTIRIGRADLRDIGPDGVTRGVALVSQEIHVFAGTLAEDLRLARPDAADDELRAALTAVDADGWVDALPAGLATVVGHGGHRLTPTQAQQLALARLVLRDPPVVVLDEATAEAGSVGARTLERAAATALQGRTAIVVAHRLAQAAAADRVVVLADGRVIQDGAHEELLATPGPYRILWSAWSAAHTTDSSSSSGSWSRRRP